MLDSQAVCKKWKYPNNDFHVLDWSNLYLLLDAFFLFTTIFKYIHSSISIQPPLSV